MNGFSQRELIRKISQYTFVAVELNLDLDTDPEDQGARAD